MAAVLDRNMEDELYQNGVVHDNSSEISPKKHGWYAD